MPADGLLVLNYDNEHTRAFAASAGCRVRFFSRKNREAFCFIDGEGLHCGGRLLLPDGGTKLVYFKREFAGFAVHLCRE